MSEQEKTEETLEEKFSRLREEGLTDKQIVRQVFEEDLKTSTKELVKITGMSKLDIGRIKGTVSRLAKGRARREKLLPREPPSPYKGPVDATFILRSILAKHPDVPEKVVNEILSWADYGFIHPTQLAYLLQSMRGIQSTTANIVAQKYSLALQKASAEGKMQMPPPVGGGMMPPQQYGFPISPIIQPQTGYPPMQYPQQFAFGQRPQQPGYYPPQYPLPPQQQDVGKVVKDQIDEVMKHVDKKFDEMKPKEEPYITVEEPVRDSEGLVILGPDKKAITRRITTPISQAGQTMMGGDPELRMLQKMGRYKELFKEDLTPEKVREIVREEHPKTPTEPPITKKDIEESAAKAAETVLAQKAAEDKDERRHREIISAIAEGGRAKAVEGYKSDSYRFLGQGLQEVAAVARDKEPIKIIIQGARDILSEGPPPKEVEAGAKEGIFGRVKKEYVAEE